MTGLRSVQSLVHHRETVIGAGLALHGDANTPGPHLAAVGSRAVPGEGREALGGGREARGNVPDHPTGGRVLAGGPVRPGDAPVLEEDDQGVLGGALAVPEGSTLAALLRQGRGLARQDDGLALLRDAPVVLGRVPGVL